MITSHKQTPHTDAVCPSCSSEYIFFTIPFFLNSKVLGVIWFIGSLIRMDRVLFDAGLFRKASKIIFCLGPRLWIMSSYAILEFSLINLKTPLVLGNNC